MDRADFQFLIYHSQQDDVAVNALIEGETIWLTQKAMSVLFGVESNTITYHLKEIFESGELTQSATARKIRVVQNSEDHL